MPACHVLRWAELPHTQDSGADIELRHGPYLARFASSEKEISAALRLRFEVFNLELSEGLETAFCNGRDVDCFDTVCDHLIAEHTPTRSVIGTYRLQTGLRAKANLGYYSQREFDFMPYEALRKSLIELGRACIHRDHRSTNVLFLLWHGIARYAVAHRAHYLIGCSSLTSQDPAQGTAVYSTLRDWTVCEELRTKPWPEFEMPLISPCSVNRTVPKLLRTYLSIGAKICGPPV